jgi:SAM-dependent methyltransferase
LAGLVKRCAENAKKFGFEKQVRAQQSDFLNLNKDFKDELGTFDAVITKGSSLPHLLTDRDLLHALKNFHALLRPGGVVNIGVRDYDYFINSKAKLYPRQVRVGKDFKEEHLIFDVWEWHKGAEGQQLVDFNTFHINGKGDQHEASKFVTTFRALFRHEMEALLEEAGFVDIKVGKIHDWLWENVYTARRPVDADPPNTRPRERRAAASSEMHADPDPATNFPWRDCDFDQQGKGK